MRAYEVNPFLDAPVYCFGVPALLWLAIYRSSSVGVYQIWVICTMEDWAFVGPFSRSYTVQGEFYSLRSNPEKCRITYVFLFIWKGTIMYNFEWCTSCRNVSCFIFAHLFSSSSYYWDAYPPFSHFLPFLVALGSFTCIFILITLICSIDYLRINGWILGIVFSHPHIASVSLFCFLTYQRSAHHWHCVATVAGSWSS